MLRPAVLGQQITIKAARTLAMRLATVFGEKTVTPFVGLVFTFPQPDRICALEDQIENYLGPLGITGAKACSILALAKALAGGLITLSYRGARGP